MGGPKGPIVFFAPRTHPNSFGWHSELVTRGFAVEAWSYYRLPGSPYSPNAREQIIKRSFLSRLWSITTRLRSDSASDEKEDTLRKTFLPSVPWLFFRCVFSRPECIVFRDRTKATLSAYWICKAAGVKNLVFYDQEPLRNNSDAPPETRIASRFRPFLRLEHATTITPIRESSDELTPNSLEKPTKDGGGRIFVPFLPSIGDARVSGHSDKSGSLKILVVAKFRKYKNLGYLVDALRCLQPSEQRMLDVTVAGRVVSANEKREFEWLKTEISSLKDLKQYSLIPNMPHEKMGLLYRQADLFVLPSSFDLAPIAPLEAMMAGAIPVVSEACGTSGYIANGKDGFVFPLNDPKELAKVISLLLEQNEILSKMKEAVRASAKYKFSGDLFFSQFSRAAKLADVR